MTIRRLDRQSTRRRTDCSGVYRLLCAVLASIQILLPTLAVALPTDGQVAAGQATIQQTNSTTLTIQQATDKAILNWNSFSIAGNEAVHFVQPSISAIALNRVIGVDSSVILGQLQSNGRIFLINPNGILFGAGAQINVGGLLATTLQIRDDDFMAGRYLFAQDPLKSLKSVVNQGTIQVSDHGFVVLAAPGVSNEGMIVANLGTAILASGKTVTVDLMGDGLINYAISGKILDQVTGPDGKLLSSAVSNSGTIQADGGQVILSARASGDIFSSVVNQSGVIRARSLENHGGVVQLLGGDETLVAATAAGAMRPAGDVSGAVINTGTIDVAAGALNAAQGSVTMVGERVGQFGSIVATGAEGANGGEVVIASTTRTLLASGSIIDVSGIGHSSGGRLLAWSDRDTFFDGGATILARGGEIGGNGGFIELSGKENLGYAGTVNALAPFGLTGTLLLDPRNITIATAGGSAYNLGVNNLFGNTPATNVIITPASINAAAANVALQANNDITVTNAIAMTNNGVGITMQAGRDILVNAGISTTNGNISLTANDSTSILANRANGAAGDIIFAAGGNLSAGTGNITLTVDPATAGNYAPGNITNVRNLTTTTGNISIISPNTVSLSGAVNAGSGAVAINANTDGAGGQSFAMNAGSSITTANAPVDITVNTTTGGTGAATLRNISSGALSVVTNPGANTTGGAITQVNGTAITATDRGQLTSGNGSISLRTLTTTGNLLIASRNAVTLNGAVNTGPGTVAINANTDGAGGQSFTMNAGSSITTTNTTAGAVQINVNAAGGGTGTAALRNVTTGSGGAITVATDTGGNATGNDITQVTGTLLNVGSGTVNLSTSTIAGRNIGTAGANILTRAGTISATSGSSGIFINNQTGVDLANINTTGAFALTTNGPITQSGAAAVTGTATVAAGAANDITLNHSGNTFGTVAITSGNNVTLRDSTALSLGTSTVSGALDVRANGNLTQSGALNVTGSSTFGVGAGNNVTLSTAANNFSSVAVTNANNVTLRDSNALILGASTVSGNLSLTTGGALSQTGAVSVVGTTTLTATAPATDILLASQANNFGGLLSFGGTRANFRDVQLGNVSASATIPSFAGLTNLRNLTLVFDTAPITLPAITLAAGGNLALSAGGAITDNGNLIVPGTTTLAAGLNNIALDNANNFTGDVSVISGNNVTLNDVNDLTLGPSIIAGTLNVTTAGAVTQIGALAVTGATMLDAGVNDIILTNGGNDFSTVGVTSGNNVTLIDANALTINASTVSGNFSANAADVTVGGAVVSTGGSLNLGAANSVTQLANLTASGANTVAVTTTTGPITMAAAATTTSGTGGINYTAGTDITLGSLSTGGGVNVSANGGSVLSAAGSGTNLTAGANSTLQAFNGVVGTSTAPVMVNVNPGMLSIRATTAVAGISAFITGTVLPSNVLTLLNVPPGLVCFNGCPIVVSNNPFANFGFIPSFNRDSAIPWYLHEPSDPPLVSVVSTYVPGTVVAEAVTDVKSNDQSVAREIPPCYPESACKPGASVLTAPADEEDPELPAAK